MPAAFSSSSVLPTEATSGIGVDHVRDRVVVHVTGLAGDDLGDRDALVLGLVREHRPGDHVADRVDAGDVGGEMRVGDDAAALHRDAELGEAEALGVGHAADRDEHDVGLDRLGRAARGRLDARLQGLARCVDAGDLATTV